MFDLVVGASSIYGGSWLEGAGAVYAENAGAALDRRPGRACRRVGRRGLRARRHRRQPVGARRGPAPARVAAPRRPARPAAGGSRRTDQRALLDRVRLRRHGRRVRRRRRSTTTLRLTGAGPARGRSRPTGPRRSSPSSPPPARRTSASSTTSPRSPRCAREYGIWFHVDGAYGGAGLAAPSVRHLFAGVERADSFIVDPHKWLFAPFDCCALLYREPALARAAHTQNAELPRRPHRRARLEPHRLLGRPHPAGPRPAVLVLPGHPRHRRLHRGGRADARGRPVRGGGDRAGATYVEAAARAGPVGDRVPPDRLDAAGLPGVVRPAAGRAGSPSSCPTTHEGETVTRFAIVNPQHHRGRHPRHPGHDGLSRPAPDGGA